VRLVSNVNLNPFSVEMSAEYRMHMLKIKHADGTFLETHDKKCEFCRLWYTHNQDSLEFLDQEVSTCGMAQKEKLTRRRN